MVERGVDSLSSVEKDEPQDRQVVPDTIRVQETADTLLVTNISSDTAEVGNLPRRDGDVVLFEDFSPGKNGLSHLLSSLKERASLGRPVRLAFWAIRLSRPIYSRKTCEVCCNPGMVGVVWDTCLCIPIFPDFVDRSYSRAKVGKCIVY